MLRKKSASCFARSRAKDPASIILRMHAKQVGLLSCLLLSSEARMLRYKEADKKAILAKQLLACGADNSYGAKRSSSLDPCYARIIAIIDLLVCYAIEESKSSP